MQTRETFFRGEVIRRESRSLPASTYNRFRILYARGRPDALFVPVRSMLFLAAVDEEEVVFLDAAVSRCRIELVWQRFRPQCREALDAPVPYELVHYTESSLTVMQRLQSEFHRALLPLMSKSKAAASASIMPFRR